MKTPLLTKVYAFTVVDSDTGQSFKLSTRRKVRLQQAQLLSVSCITPIYIYIPILITGVHKDPLKKSLTLFTQ